MLKVLLVLLVVVVAAGVVARALRGRSPHPVDPTARAAKAATDAAIIQRQGGQGGGQGGVGGGMGI